MFSSNPNDLSLLLTDVVSSILSLSEYNDTSGGNHELPWDHIISPFDSKGYLPVLKEGVAHAKGTGFPGGGRNIYLFAHSTDSFLNFRQYNAVFYLLGKLENGDEIDIFYKNSLFRYEVIEKKVVFPEAIHYLDSDEEEILTLQTCYPPGTTLKRLIVRAKKKEINN